MLFNEVSDALEKNKIYFGQLLKDLKCFGSFHGIYQIAISNTK